MEVYKSKLHGEKSKLIEKIRWNGNVKFNESNGIPVKSLPEWTEEKRCCHRLKTK